MNNNQNFEIFFNMLDKIEKSIVQILNENATLAETNEKLRLKNSILERENHMSVRLKKKIQKLESQRKLIRQKVNRIMETLKGI